MRFLDSPGKDEIKRQNKKLREVDLLVRLQEFFNGKNWGSDTKKVKRFQEDIKVLLED